MPVRSAARRAASASIAMPSTQAGAAVCASTEPPATGTFGGGAFGRIRRSTVARPALPMAKPPPSSSASAAAWPKLPRLSWNLVTAASTISKP